MADALVSVLLDQLALISRQQLEQEVRLVVGVEKEVTKLTCNLQAIQAVLKDAERRQVKDIVVKQWLDKLKDVSFDMDDVLDEWNTAILKRQIEEDGNAPRPKKKVCSFIPSSCFCCRQVSLRRDIAIKIKELNKTLDGIATEKNTYGFSPTSSIEEPERPTTTSFIDVPEVYGRDHDKNRIIDMLLSESSQGPTPRTISIVGMGGIGKTTLAQLVYNDDTVKAHFEQRIWVCVSDPFDEIRIAKAIHEALTTVASNLSELESLLQDIHHSIEGKKFLLVLDDVWTEDSKKWEPLKSSLKCGSLRSKILVTTRKENVAYIMGTRTTDIHLLGHLSKDECWSLFSHVAFSERTSEEREKLTGIGLQIVDKCKGLPLAAKTLGSLLRFKQTIEQWQSVLDSHVWELEEVERGLFPPLLLSYYDLSSTMRRCFSYCAIFPKDYQLDKDTLIKLWMAQGYLKARGNEEMEMIGEECFQNLAMRSFFQDFGRNKNGSIINCKMHDIVHDFAQFLTKNECLMVEVSNPEEPRIESSYVKTRHLYMNIAEGVSIPIFVYNVKNLRSLIFRSNDSKDLPIDQLTCLRALDFGWYKPKEFPKEIERLIHLRYLNLGYHPNLEALPETVCELCNLQTLNVSGCQALKQLPHGLGKLINLRHLEVGITNINFMPKGIERLTSLRTLDKFIVSDGNNDGEASSLEGLKNLNYLRGKLSIVGMGDVRDVDEVKKAQLKKKQHLLRLFLLFSVKEVEGRRINDEEIIGKVEPPPNLEELGIVSYRGTRVLLNWAKSLTKLRKVQLCNFMNCELLPPLGKLPFLESLSIGRTFTIEENGVTSYFANGGMRRLKRMGIEFLGLENNNEGASKRYEVSFPMLKELRLWELYKLEEWDYGITCGMGEKEEDITSALTIMPCLRELTICGCPKLKAIPDHLLHSTSLKELRIHKSPILKERYYNGREGEDWPKIFNIPNIIIDDYYVQKEGRILETPEAVSVESSFGNENWLDYIY